MLLLPRGNYEYSHLQRINTQSKSANKPHDFHWSIFFLHPVLAGCLSPAVLMHACILPALKTLYIHAFRKQSKQLRMTRISLQVSADMLPPFLSQTPSLPHPFPGTPGNFRGWNQPSEAQLFLIFQQDFS